MAARPTREDAAGDGDDPEDAAASRMAALTASLSEVLVAAAPWDDLVERLARVTRATVALLDGDGGVLRSSGTLPQALVAKELPAAGSSPHLFTTDGWSGAVLAVPSTDAVVSSAARWLVALSRRPGFPNAVDRAAIAVSGSLAGAIGLGQAAQVRQGRAASAGVLERALEVPPRREDPELAARVADLGIALDGGVRVVVAVPMRHAGRPGARSPRSPAEVGDALERACRARGVPLLLTIRNDHVVLMAQAASDDVRRVVSAAGADAVAYVGIGRSVTSVGAVVDSYHDAHFAARVARRRGGAGAVLAYEDFDFATRLFADVGLETMAEWAADHLGPLDGRGPLVTGLATYFAANQNVKVAARELGIHQNSMRYRLAKVEELLGIDLADPAAVASIHLALTALDLADPAAAQRAPVPRRGGSAVHDADSPEAVTGFDRSGAASFGAVDPSS